jgi:hypothetical protein
MQEFQHKLILEVGLPHLFKIQQSSRSFRSGTFHRIFFTYKFAILLVAALMVCCCNFIALLFNDLGNGYLHT